MSAVAQIDRGRASRGADPTSTNDCIRFEIRDGIRRVSCAVSAEALDAAAGLTHPATPETRRRAFDRHRTLINAAALIRLGTRPPGCVDPILVTSRDLQRVAPQAGTPKFGTSAASATIAPAAAAAARALRRDLKGA